LHGWLIPSAFTCSAQISSLARLHQIHNSQELEFD